MHRSGGCPIPGIIQDKIGWDFEQLNQVEDVPPHCGGATQDVL